MPSLKGVSWMTSMGLAARSRPKAIISFLPSSDSYSSLRVGDVARVEDLLAGDGVAELGGRVDAHLGNVGAADRAGR